ncbi:MAG: SRPBCC family protein [Longimicrobiales bacterium]
MSASPFSVGVRVLGAGAALLLLFLGLGFALPGTWAAERTAVLSASPEALFPLLERPAAWSAWTAWPDSGLAAGGPERGVGARLAWESDDLGSGSFVIVEAVAPVRVRYRVEVQGGSMRTEGTFLLAREGTGSRVTWREEGDFGWNPLMGYWALFMGRAQSRELEKALARLEEATAPAGR